MRQISLGIKQAFSNFVFRSFPQLYNPLFFCWLLAASNNLFRFSTLLSLLSVSIQQKLVTKAFLSCCDHEPSGLPARRPIAFPNAEKSSGPRNATFYIPQCRNILVPGATLQRQNAENLKQIFPEKEYRGLSTNFHIHHIIIII
jgi:hypothetical protein